MLDSLHCEQDHHTSSRRYSHQGCHFCVVFGTNDRCQPRGNIENQAGKFWVLQQRGQTDLFNYTAVTAERCGLTVIQLPEIYN